MIVIKNLPASVEDLGDPVGSLGHKDPIDDVGLKPITGGSIPSFLILG